MYDIKGKEAGTVDLPKEIFAVKTSSTLLSQAVCVYLVNQRQGNAVTLTRGEVTGSTRKIYKQKGTGRARHGGVRAPIFVHGGIAHGPKLKDYSLRLPTKMRRRALFGSLTMKLEEGKIKVITGLEKIEPKTKNMVALMSELQFPIGKSVLVVLPKDTIELYRMMRNIQGVTVVAVDRLNTYEVVKNKTILFMHDAIEGLQKTFLTKEK